MNSSVLEASSGECRASDTESVERSKNKEVVGESPIIHSVGTLAQLFRVPVHRIEYVIRSRGIYHVGVAGNVRLFNSAAAQRVGSELQRIADARSKKGYARTGPRKWLRDSTLNSTVQEEVR